MIEWLLSLLEGDENKYIRPKSTPEKIYKNNKKFCDDRGITLDEIKHDIEEGWLYPSEQLKINFSGTYSESKSELPPERKSRKRISRRVMENHREDSAYRISNDTKLQQDLEKLCKK